MDLFRRLMHFLFGVELCILIDYDGDLHLRRVMNYGTRKMAWRQGMGVRKVVLLDNGKVFGASYCERWEPYNAPSLMDFFKKKG